MMTSKEKLEDFIDDVLNSSDDEVDIKECSSYKSLVKDLEVLEILKRNLKLGAPLFGSEEDYQKIKEWLEEK